MNNTLTCPELLHPFDPLLFDPLPDDVLLDLGNWVDTYVSEHEKDKIQAAQLAIDDFTPQYIFGTKSLNPKWLEERADRITATDAHVVLAQRGRGQSRAKLKSLKVSRSVNGNFQTAAMKRGVNLEDEIKNIYAADKNLEVVTTGLHTHKVYPWLGATPDGINVTEGRLLEIKCHSSYGGYATKLPLPYWIQAQIQLQVCGLRFCDCMRALVDIDDEGTVTFNMENTKIDIVKRDDDWFASVLPRLKSFWTEVMEDRYYNVRK